VIFSVCLPASPLTPTLTRFTVILYLLQYVFPLLSRVVKPIAELIYGDLRSPREKKDAERRVNMWQEYADGAVVDARLRDDDEREENDGKGALKEDIGNKWVSEEGKNGNGKGWKSLFNANSKPSAALDGSTRELADLFSANSRVFPQTRSFGVSTQHQAHSYSNTPAFPSLDRNSTIESCSSVASASKTSVRQPIPALMSPISKLLYSPYTLQYSPPHSKSLLIPEPFSFSGPFSGNAHFSRHPTTPYAPASLGSTNISSIIGATNPTALNTPIRPSQRQPQEHISSNLALCNRDKIAPSKIQGKRAACDTSAPMALPAMPSAMHLRISDSPTTRAYLPSVEIPSSIKLRELRRPESRTSTVVKPWCLNFPSSCRAQLTPTPASLIPERARPMHVFYSSERYTHGNISVFPNYPTLDSAAAPAASTSANDCGIPDVPDQSSLYEDLSRLGSGEQLGRKTLDIAGTSKMSAVPIPEFPSFAGVYGAVARSDAADHLLEVGENIFPGRVKTPNEADSTFAMVSCMKKGVETANEANPTTFSVAVPPFSCHAGPEFRNARKFARFNAAVPGHQEDSAQPRNSRSIFPQSCPHLRLKSRKMSESEHPATQLTRVESMMSQKPIEFPKVDRVSGTGPDNLNGIDDDTGCKTHDDNHVEAGRTTALTKGASASVSEKFNGKVDQCTHASHGTTPMIASARRNSLADGFYNHIYESNSILARRNTFEPTAGDVERELDEHGLKVELNHPSTGTLPHAGEKSVGHSFEKSRTGSAGSKIYGKPSARYLTMCCEDVLCLHRLMRYEEVRRERGDESYPADEPTLNSICSHDVPCTPNIGNIASGLARLSRKRLRVSSAPSLAPGTGAESWIKVTETVDKSSTITYSTAATRGAFPVILRQETGSVTRRVIARVRNSAENHGRATHCGVDCACFGNENAVICRCDVVNRARSSTQTQFVFPSLRPHGVAENGWLQSKTQVDDARDALKLDIEAESRTSHMALHFSRQAQQPPFLWSRGTQSDERRLESCSTIRRLHDGDHKNVPSNWYPSISLDHSPTTATFHFTQDPDSKLPVLNRRSSTATDWYFPSEPYSPNSFYERERLRFVTEGPLTPPSFPVLLHNALGAFTEKTVRVSSLSLFSVVEKVQGVYENVVANPTRNVLNRILNRLVAVLRQESEEMRYL